MEIKILGTGCAKCNALERLTRQAVQDLKLECEIQKVGDIEEILGYGLMRTPGLVINGKLKVEGMLPSLAELKMLIYQNSL